MKIRKLFLLAFCFAGLSGAEAQTLLVVNQNDRSVSVVDVKAAREVAVIKETIPKQWAHEVATSPDARTAYLPIYGDSGVGEPGIDGSKMLIVDVPARQVTATVEFGRGVRPHSIVYDPLRKLFYITTELANSITIFDPATQKIVGSIPTSSAQSHMLAISHDGRFAYVANVEPGSVSVIDLSSRSTIKVIPISVHAQRVSISNDDKMVFTADRTKPQLAVIDTATYAVKTWIKLPGLGFGAAPAQDGQSLLIALPALNKVAVVDLKTLTLTRTIDVCKSPQEILVSPAGRPYVSCSASNQVAEIDLSQGKVRQIIAVGAGPDGLGWLEK